MGNKRGQHLQSLGVYQLQHGTLYTKKEDTVSINTHHLAVQLSQQDYIGGVGVVVAFRRHVGAVEQGISL